MSYNTKIFSRIYSILEISKILIDLFKRKFYRVNSKINIWNIFSNLNNNILSFLDYKKKREQLVSIIAPPQLFYFL